MLEHKVYSFSDLKALLSETRSEFSPKYGKGYNADTEEKENGKAVKDIARQTKEMDGGLQDSVSRNTNPEGIKDKNKTTLEYDFDYEPSDSYKERVKSQVHGYASKSEEDNSKKSDYVKAADFDGNKDFYNSRKKSGEEDAKAEQEYRHAGLKAHNLPKENYKNNTLFNESKKMKRLHFKNTVFLNEADMLKRIPSDYKIDGSRFIMKDSKGNEYLVECKKDALCEGYIHTNVIDHACGKAAINEALQKFNHLSGYKSSDYNSKVNQLDESQKYGDLLNVARNLEDKLLNK